MEGVRTHHAAGRQGAHPRRDRLDDELHKHPELVAERIPRYAKLVGRENVIAGTDCGFGTWVGQSAVDPDIVWAKLATLAEGARIASRELF